MKINKIALLVFLFFGLNFIANGQDTIVVQDRSEFETIIRYSYIDYTNYMNQDIRTKIDSVFSNYDFEKEIYECHYSFSFIIELDSCGFIVRCEPSDRNGSMQDLKLFENEVISIILNSNWQIKNEFKSENIGCHFIDELVNFKVFRFGFDISCDPTEIIYIEDGNLINGGTIFMYNGENGPVYFSGFKTGC